MRYPIFFLFLLALLTVSCKKDQPQEVSEPYLVILFGTRFFDVDFSYGLIQENSILESQLSNPTGLVYSRNNSDVVWAHNNKGNLNKIYAIGKNGSNRVSYTINGATNRDWEDIAIGKGPNPNLNYLYIADIGDDNTTYNSIVIYRFVEPTIQNNLAPGSTLNISSNLVNRFEFVYPDGPKNAEALMIDPLNGDLYIVSKTNDSSIIYKTPMPQSGQGQATLEKVAVLPLSNIVAADISSCGTKIALKDSIRIYTWDRNIEETVINGLNKKPLRLPYIIEPHGYSFAWTENATGYFTLSKQTSPTTTPILYYYEQSE